ncbi:MAG TPA: PQQ-dependent sugar dehydrogenase [Chitinophagaceae bacterium]
MKNNRIITIVFITLFCVTCSDNRSQSPASPRDATNTTGAVIRIVKKGLNYPWEIIWGKDNRIWMTERDGKISSIDPSNGNTIFSFTISEVEARNEGGLLGMALHPDFQHNGLLYVVYNYNNHNKHFEKLVCYTYANNTLSHPVVLLDGIVGSTNHNGSRLWITNDANPKIFLTTGDSFNSDLSQPTNTLNGKILRVNLDGSIPSDNPFPNNPVWTYGHRNPQGLVVVNDIIYASEHGPDIEDEVNIIEKGRNYGWPNVEGPCNGDEISFCKSHNVKEPIWSSGDNTLAVCGLDYYNNDRIPQWKNSLIMMTLKNSSIRQLQLSDNGRSIVDSKTYFENKWGRLRDICISQDGKVYVCTSNGGNNDMIIEISKL